MDSAFTNQNKHCYRLLISSTGEDVSSMEQLLAGAAINSRGDLAIEKDFPHDGDGDLFAVDLLVRERGGGREGAFLDRLNTRLDGVRIAHLVAGEVWRLLIRAPGAAEAGERARELAVTRSRREGLLLNPHYQTYEFISTIRLGSREVRQ
jgi:hypothetical protein